jgi:hypothetical protein
MKSRFLLILGLVILLNTTARYEVAAQNFTASTDYIDALKDTLTSLAELSNEPFFILHCQSIIDVIEAKPSLSSVDSNMLKNMYTAFNNEDDTCSMKDFNSYIKRRRSLIIAWTSPTDGALSFSWLKLPKDWNPNTSYPLYIMLHGLWGVADNPIDYLTYPFLGSPSTSATWEDGYLLSPWGRGNLWYQGISETDIWECMTALEQYAQTVPQRKYIAGHSMGGYGAWHIALNSPDTWAALGVYAGALWYGSPDELSEEAGQTLRNLPTYFVCGTNDGLLGVNQTAYALLEDAGNENIAFVTFVGAHDYLEENVLNMYLWMRAFVNEDYNGIKEPVVNMERSHPKLDIWPNPLQTETNLSFNLPADSKIILEIYDQNGRSRGILVDEYRAAGRYTLHWNRGNLPSGIYYLRMKTSGYYLTAKMLTE